MNRRAKLIVAAIVAVAFVLPVALALAVRALFVEAFVVPSGAMAPTLLPGDQLFADKRAAGDPPKRGDVVVFAFPEDRSVDFVFRVVGLSGDTLEMRGDRVVLNGTPIPRCRLGRAPLSDGSTREADFYVELLDGRAWLTQYEVAAPSVDVKGPWRVKPGEAFVLGDNRNNSRDSRFWFTLQGASVPFADIRGRATRIWKSPHEGRFWVDLGGAPVLPPQAKRLEPELRRCLGPNPPLDPP